MTADFSGTVSYARIFALQLKANLFNNLAYCQIIQITLGLKIILTKN